MPERSRKPRPADLNRLAASIVRDSTDDDKADELVDDGKDPAAVALGRRGGLKGGNARAAKLTAEQRSEIAEGSSGPLVELEQRQSRRLREQVLLHRLSLRGRALNESKSGLSNIRGSDRKFSSYMPNRFAGGTLIVNYLFKYLRGFPLDFFRLAGGKAASG